MRKFISFSAAVLQSTGVSSYKHVGSYDVNVAFEEILGFVSEKQTIDDKIQETTDAMVGSKTFTVFATKPQVVNLVKYCNGHAERIVDNSPFKVFS